MFKIIKQFTIAYTISTVAFLPFVLLMTLFNFDIPSGISIVIPGLSGAYVGYRYAKQYKEIPAKTLSWKISAYTIPVMFIVNIPFTLAIIFTDQAVFKPLLEISRIMLISIIVAILLFASLVHVLSVRLTIRMFAKYALK